MPRKKKAVDGSGVQKLWREFDGDRTNYHLRNRLVLHYKRLVDYHANRVWQRLPKAMIITFDDLINWGVLGLIDSINNFDLGRKIKFESFCALRVRGAILDGLREMDWVPRSTRSRATKLAVARNNLEGRLRRQPTDKELAKELGVEKGGLGRTVADSQPVRVMSLYTQHNSGYETESLRDVYQIDLVTDERVDDPTKDEQELDFFRLVLRGCNKTERLIILLYYREEMTMREIGKELDLSESRISQIHDDIIRRMRKRLNEREEELAEVA